MRKILAILTIVSLLYGSLPAWTMETEIPELPKKTLITTFKDWWSSLTTYEDSLEEEAAFMIAMTLVIAYGTYSLGDIVEK